MSVTAQTQSLISNLYNMLCLTAFQKNVILQRKLLAGLFLSMIEQDSGH